MRKIEVAAKYGTKILKLNKRHQKRIAAMNRRGNIYSEIWTSTDEKVIEITLTAKRNISKEKMESIVELIKKSF